MWRLFPLVYSKISGNLEGAGILQPSGVRKESSGFLLSVLPFSIPARSVDFCLSATTKISKLRTFSLLNCLLFVGCWGTYLGHRLGFDDVVVAGLVGLEIQTK